MGRLNEQKNVALLLRALAQLAASTQVPFRASIVGNGPLRAGLRSLATDLGLDGSVEWIDWLPRDRMPALYQSANCIVNPSHYEGMPNVVLEAMACAVPAIVSDVAGNRDVVRHGEDGLVVAHDSLPALVEAMSRALGDPGYLAYLGARARVCAVQRFSWDATTSGFIDVLSQANKAK